MSDPKTDAVELRYMRDAVRKTTCELQRARLDYADLLVSLQRADELNKWYEGRCKWLGSEIDRLRGLLKGEGQ